MYLNSCHFMRKLYLSAFIFSVLSFSTGALSQSLLWKISGRDMPDPSYLYGTIHLKDHRVFEWSDSIYTRIDKCQAYAGEIDLSAENLMKAARNMVLPEGQTLRDRFAPDEYQIIREAIKSCSGYELSLLDKLKPVSLIALCFMQNQSADLEATVDELLYKRAVEGGKMTSGVETIEEQAALMDKIPDSYVLSYFQNLDEQKEELDKLLDCYRSADLQCLWKMMQEEESGSLLNEELIRVRNYRMTERIIPLITRQSTFIALGSGHLPGEEGVIALLRKAGFIVEAERIIW